MNTPEFQKSGAGRRRGRYSDEFKRKVIAACLEPGVSTAAVALANGLNANLLRRWVVDSSPHSNSRNFKKPGAAAFLSRLPNTTDLQPVRALPVPRRACG